MFRNFVFGCPGTFTRTWTEFIRVFLRRYDKYRREVFPRASQLNAEYATSLEPVNTVGVIYCVNATQLESAIECSMIAGWKEVEMLKSADLDKFFDKMLQEVKDVVTEAERTPTAQAEKQMKMYVKSAKGSMKLHFMDYDLLLRNNTIKWVTRKTPSGCEACPVGLEACAASLTT